IVIVYSGFLVEPGNPTPRFLKASCPCSAGRGVMASTDTGVRVDDLAQRLCDVLTQFALAVPRGRRGGGDLREVEFLTLSILYHQGRMIVGDIQRQLVVLPPKMPRVIRSLENRERPLIACHINPHDKRKIDVSLPPAGTTA